MSKFLNLLLSFHFLQNGAWAQNDMLFESCETVENKLGKCIRIDHCPSLLQLVKISEIHEEVRNYLIFNHCGFERKIPKVCCILNEEMTTSSPKRLVALALSDTLESKVSPNYETCGYSTGFRSLGEIAEHNEFPWLAALQYSTANGPEFHCGGVLINERHVLTAAHCVTNLPKDWKLIAVRLGEYDFAKDNDCEDIYKEVCNDPPINIKIENSLVHEAYNPFNSDNDIALLKLDTPIQYTEFVQPICLPLFPDISKSHLKNYYLVTAGWGLTRNGIISNRKGKFTVPVKSKNECVTANRTSQLTDKQICLAGDPNGNFCKSDSGGALMDLHYYSGEAYWYIAGIQSFSPSNCVSENLSIYTSVIDYLPWIVNKLR